MHFIEHLKSSSSLSRKAKDQQGERKDRNSRGFSEQHVPASKQKLSNPEASRSQREEKMAKSRADEEPLPRGATRTTASTSKSHTDRYPADKMSSESSAIARETAKVDGSKRPGLQRNSTLKTQYIDMLLSLDSIPLWHNVLASICTWLLLAGYLVFPATFTSIRRSDRLVQDSGNRIEQKILSTVANAPLLWIAAFSCGIGIAGCLYLWIKNRKNFLWLINRIFLPSFMNALAGLISTLVNVYSARHGEFSVTARITLVVTSALAAVMSGLWLLYQFVALRKVKRRHAKEVGSASDGDVEAVPAKE